MNNETEFTLRDDGIIWDNLKNDEVWCILNNINSKNNDCEEYFTTRLPDVKCYEISYCSGFDNTVFESYNDKPNPAPSCNVLAKLKLRTALIKVNNDPNGSQYYIWELTTNETLTDSYMAVYNRHPFARIEPNEILFNNDKTLSIRNICAKNSVTDSLFKMIMMSEEELTENSGMIINYGYRQRLVNILHDELSD